LWPNDICAQTILSAALRFLIICALCFIKCINSEQLLQIFTIKVFNSISNDKYHAYRCIFKQKFQFDSLQNDQSFLKSLTFFSISLLYLFNRGTCNEFYISIQNGRKYDTFISYPKTREACIHFKIRCRRMGRVE
jgi:hypothetical protein